MFGVNSIEVQVFYLEETLSSYYFLEPNFLQINEILPLFDFRQLKWIASIQNYFDRKGSMSKCLPHLATRNEDVAREVLGFLCVLLFNANQTVQVYSVLFLNEMYRKDYKTII